MLKTHNYITHWDIAFEDVGAFYELFDLCKGYGQAFEYVKTIKDKRFADQLLRFFVSLTPCQRNMISCN